MTLSFTTNARGALLQLFLFFFFFTTSVQEVSAQPPPDWVQSAERCFELQEEGSSIDILFQNKDNPANDNWIGIYPADATSPFEEPWIWQWICGHSRNDPCASNDNVPTDGMIRFDASNVRVWPLPRGQYRAVLAQEVPMHFDEYIFWDVSPRFRISSNCGQYNNNNDNNNNNNDNEEEEEEQEAEEEEQQEENNFPSIGNPNDGRVSDQQQQEEEEEENTTEQPTLSPTTLAPTTLSPTSLAPTTASPTTMAPTANPSFRLRLYWEAGYDWQGSYEESFWCMTRNVTSTTCWHGLLKVTCSPLETYVRECEDRRYNQEQLWKFVPISTRSNDVLIQADGTNWCLQRQNWDIYLQTCDPNNPYQHFYAVRGGFDEYRFEVGQRSMNGYCMSQEHHPKHNEYVQFFPCSWNRNINSLTSYWEAYNMDLD